jgi:hypothetical protein
MQCGWRETCFADAVFVRLLGGVVERALASRSSFNGAIIMPYSCTDFADDITEALKVVIPEEDNDDPGAQAVICLEEIGRLQEAATKGFTSLDVEAALCIWECLNEWTLDSDEEMVKLQEAAKDNPHSHAAIRLEWIAVRGVTGSAEMRSQCMVLAKWALEVYGLLTKDDEDFFSWWSYDWEVIPLIMKYAVSKDGKASMYRGDYIYTGGSLIDAHTAAQFVAQEILWWRFQSDCKSQARKQWAYEELVTDDGGDRMRQSFETGEEPRDFVKWLGDKFDLTPKGTW